MLNLIQSQNLSPGDKVATVSLSWGGAGDENIRWRYEQGKERLETLFGLQVVEMPHTLAGSEFIYNHPEKRAEDLMSAFLDPTIKAIIACIGGIESVRMLPFIDFDVIRNHPKPFIGYSDSTTTHLMCLKAGISSIYGPTLLVDFAENVAMHPYTLDSFKKTLFSTDVIGPILAAPKWTSAHLPWDVENSHLTRAMYPNLGYELLQGTGFVQGRLIGGCLEVLDALRGTEIFPSNEHFDDAILFLETSEDKPPAWLVECVLRNYGITGILGRLKGIIWGKPQDETYYDDYKAVIRKVLKEFNLTHLPVLFNMNFGHTEPKFCLPYGAMAQIDCEKMTFEILEAAVLN